MKLTFALLLAFSAASAIAGPCDAPEHRQFDFWIGEWTVTTPAGKLAGTNRITKIEGGCALLEEWKGSGAVTGRSLNIYDARQKAWHQTWVDNSGSLLQIDGGFENGAMRMSSATQRITWSQLPGGDVRQLWEQSADGGKTWNVAFDGRYTKTKK